MKRRLLVASMLVFVSTVLATLAVAGRNFHAGRLHDVLGAEVCVAITARVQVGGARDAFDQAHAILNVSSRGGKTFVNLKDGTEEFGERPTEDGSYYAVECKIEGRPDMSFTFYFEKAPLFGVTWATTAAILVALLILLSLAYHAVSSRLVAIVQAQLSSGMSLVLGGGTRPQGIGRFFERILENTPAIRKLKRELEEKRKLVDENAAFRERVSNLAEENSERVQREKTNAEIVSQVRHDLRSPLAYLKVFGQTLMSDAEIYHLSVQKIDRILQDLNQVAGAEVRSGDTGDRCLVECVLVECIAAKRAAWKRPVELSLDIDKQNLSLVAADPVRLARIIDNLLQNAFDAVSDSGKIRLEARGSQREVEVRICDDGVGIPESILSRIGSERITVGKRDGNGIGLHSAKQWVEAWGGTLSIESAHGLGTMVSVRLPWVRTAARFLGAIPLEVGQELVVVDDEREVAERLIQRHGGRGRCFESIASYAKWLDSVDVSSDKLVSVFDLHLMPGSGLDLLRLHPWPRRAVLHTDDYLNAEAVELSAELGFGILPKGFLAAENP